tara:strand:+ start:129 stop:1379 length:1251 start_codon:yes stop_codon:yes gene_type:complete
MSTNKERTQQPKTSYHGWKVVIVSAIFQLLFGGLYHTGMSAYFLPISRTFNLTKTQMSLAFTIRSLEGGLEGPIAGYLVDKYGPKAIILIGVISGGIGFILIGIAPTYMFFLITFLTFLTIGFSIPHHGISAAINAWFRKRLGIAMSWSTVGSAIGSSVLTFVIAQIIFSFNWRVACISSGILILIVGIPLSLFIRLPKPHEADIEDEEDLSNNHEPLNLHDFGIREALQSSTYWLLSIAIGLRLTAQSAIMVHMVPILVSRGIDEQIAAVFLVPAAAFTRIPAILIMGIISDRWSRPKVAGLAMLAGICSTLIILYGPNGIVTGIIFVSFFGIAMSSNAIGWSLVGQFFGRKNYGSLRGGVTMIQSIMSAVSPLLTGWLADKQGDYVLAMQLMCGIYIISTILFWILKQPVVKES